MTSVLSAHYAVYTQIHENPPVTFRFILLTNKQTNKPTACSTPRQSGGRPNYFARLRTTDSNMPLFCHLWPLTFDSKYTWSKRLIILTYGRRTKWLLVLTLHFKRTLSTSEIFFYLEDNCQSALTRDEIDIVTVVAWSVCIQAGGVAMGPEGVPATDRDPVRRVWRLPFPSANPNSPSINLLEFPAIFLSPYYSLIGRGPSPPIRLPESAYCSPHFLQLDNASVRMTSELLYNLL